MAEAVFVELDSESPTELLDRVRYLHPNREDHQVEALVLELARFILVAHQQITGGGIFAQASEAAPGVLDAVPIAGPFVVAPIALGERPHVHHEDMDVQIGLVFLGHDCFLGGIHAAHRRAVVVALVA